MVANTNTAVVGLYWLGWPAVVGSSVVFDMALVAVGVAVGVASVGFNETVWLLHRSPLQQTMLQSSNDQSSSELKKAVKALQPSVTSGQAIQPRLTPARTTVEPFLNLYLPAAEKQLSVVGEVQFWTVDSFTHKSKLSSRHAWHWVVLMPLSALTAPIPSMMQNKAKDIAMIPLVKDSFNTPGTTRRHKVKCNAQRNFSNWTWMTDANYMS